MKFLKGKMDKTEGYFILWRSVFKDSLWTNGTYVQKLLMVLLIGLVNHSPQEWIWQGKKITIEKGQKITSLSNLKELLGKDISIMQIRRSLDNLEKHDFITMSSTKTGRLISILNYEELTMLPTKEVTKNRQRTDKEPTTNNTLNTLNTLNNNIIPADVLQKQKSESKKPKISFNFDTVKWENVTQKDLEVWNKAYPACDLKLEFAQMKAWILSAGAKGHKTNWHSFITRWLQKSQDRGGTPNGTDKKYR